MSSSVPAGRRPKSATTTGTARTGTRAAGRQAADTGRRAAHSRTVQLAGRLGLACRGVLYVLIGLLALQIAFGHGGEEADSSGALRAVADTPIGGIVLWLLAVGFAGLALWQLTVAAFEPDVELKDRAAAAGRVVIYTALCVSTVLFLTGSGKQSSSDQKSQGFTARAMEHTGGRVLVGAVGLAVLGAGIFFAVRGVRRSFLRNLDLSTASPRTRQVVEGLGLVGNVARGVAFGAVGVFLVEAAVTYDPNKAKGLDGALRTFADTPLGPWLLALVAVGLILFGAYSFCQARFQRRKAAAASS